MNIFYQLKDLIMLYSNANIMIIYFKFFLSFYFFIFLFFFLLMTRGIWYIHLVDCLMFVCCILYQFSFSYFHLFIVANVYYQYYQEYIYIYIWKKNSINYIRAKLSWISSMIVLTLSPLPISTGISKKLGICYKIGSSYIF